MLNIYRINVFQSMQYDSLTLSLTHKCYHKCLASQTNRIHSSEEHSILDIGKNHRTQQKLFIICYTRQLVSTQLWGHHQAINKNRRNEMYVEVTRALRDPVRFTLVVVHTDGNYFF
jgi:hypothetical protein